MRPLIILNPHSQGGKTGRQAGALTGVVERYLGAVDAVHTERPRHAVELAEAAAKEGRSTVISVGGDGTFHEIVNGLMRAQAGGVSALPTLGIVGQGTGGDFRKSLGLEHRLDRYCEAMSGRVTRAVDVARFTYHDRDGQLAEDYFVNILSAGMGGLVDEYVAKSSRRFGGSAAYLGAAVRALVENEVGIVAATLHTDDGVEEVELPTRLIAICNGRFFGGGMEVAPMAVVDDGWLDVVSLGAASKLQFALGNLAVYGGTHLRNPHVSVHRCRRVELTLRNDAIAARFPLDVDGEPLGHLPITVELVPRAIDVFVPPT